MRVPALTASLKPFSQAGTKAGGMLLPTAGWRAGQEVEGQGQGLGFRVRFRFRVRV
jgi:hypothetical protein